MTKLSHPPDHYGAATLFGCSLVLMLVISACTKEVKDLPEPQIQPAAPVRSSIAGISLSYCWQDAEDGYAYDSILKPTILGARLTGNPYSVATMQQASRNLTGGTTGITENQWYVRFKPSSPTQLATLEELDIDLFDYPLDYKILQEGDYYDDGVTPAEEIPWLYAVVNAGFTPPSALLMSCCNVCTCLTTTGWKTRLSALRVIM